MCQDFSWKWDNITSSTPWLLINKYQCPVIPIAHWQHVTIVHRLHPFCNICIPVTLPQTQYTNIHTCRLACAHTHIHTHTHAHTQRVRHPIKVSHYTNHMVKIIMIKWLIQHYIIVIIMFTHSITLIVTINFPAPNEATLTV